MLRERETGRKKNMNGRRERREKRGRKRSLRGDLRGVKKVLGPENVEE